MKLNAFLYGKLSEKRLNVKVRSIGELMTAKYQLDDMQLCRRQHQQSIAGVCDVFEWTAFGFHLQIGWPKSANKFSSPAKPEQCGRRDNECSAAEKTEPARIVEGPHPDRPDIVTEIIELEKAIRFQDVHLVVQSNEDFFRLPQPRALIIDVAEGPFKTGVPREFDYAKVVAVEHEEIAKTRKGNAERVSKPCIGKGGVTRGKRGDKVEIAVESLDAMITVVGHVEIQPVRGQTCGLVKRCGRPAIASHRTDGGVIPFEPEDHITLGVGDVDPPLRSRDEARRLKKRTEDLNFCERRIGPGFKARSPDTQQKCDYLRKRCQSGSCSSPRFVE